MIHVIKSCDYLFDNIYIYKDTSFYYVLIFRFFECKFSNVNISKVNIGNVNIFWKFFLKIFN